jgi:hypothetical protein
MCHVEKSVKASEKREQQVIFANVFSKRGVFVKTLGVKTERFSGLPCKLMIRLFIALVGDDFKGVCAV